MTRRSGDAYPDFQSASHQPTGFSRWSLSGVGDAEDAVTRHAGEVTGELRLSAPVSFGLTHLAPLWPVFMARHPKLNLDVALADRFVDLVDEGFDVTVRIAQLQSSSLVGAHLASGALVEVMPDHRSIELGVHAVYPRRKQLAPKVRLLADFLVESFRERIWAA